MTDFKAGIPSVRKNSGWLKPTLIVLCLITAGFGAITVAEVNNSQSHAVAIPVAQRAESASADTPKSTQARTHAVNNKVSEAPSSPRECRPYEGEVSECTFN